MKFAYNVADTINYVSIAWNIVLNKLVVCEFFTHQDLHQSITTEVNKDVLEKHQEKISTHCRITRK